MYKVTRVTFGVSLWRVTVYSGIYIYVPCPNNQYQNGTGYSATYGSLIKAFAYTSALVVISIHWRVTLASHYHSIYM
jgi:hypothetical protein